MLNIYVCKILKEFDFNRVGEIKKFFSYDYDRILKGHKSDIKLLRMECLK